MQWSWHHPAAQWDRHQPLTVPLAPHPRGGDTALATHRRGGDPPPPTGDLPGRTVRAASRAVRGISSAADRGHRSAGDGWFPQISLSGCSAPEPSPVRPGLHRRVQTCTAALRTAPLRPELHHCALHCTAAWRCSQNCTQLVGAAEPEPAGGGAELWTDTQPGQMV